MVNLALVRLIRLKLCSDAAILLNMADEMPGAKLCFEEIICPLTAQE
jgi:hypothetical protein